MKKIYMKKIAKICAELNELKEAFEEEAEKIEANADEKGRELTEKEEEKVSEYIDAADEIQNAIDYIEPYADDCEW